MFTRYRSTVELFFRVADIAVVVAMWFAAYPLRFHVGPFAITKEVPPFSEHADLATFVAILWATVFSLMRVYESQRMRNLRDDLLLILKAHGLSMLGFVAITYFREDYKYSRLVVLYFGALGAIAIVGFRLGVRIVLRYARARGYNLRHVIGVGEGRAMEDLISRLQRYPELGLRMRGIVTRDGSRGASTAGVPVLGRFEQLRDLIQEHSVAEVLVALPPEQNALLESVLDGLQDETVDIRVVPDVTRYITLGCDIENFDGLPVLRLNDSPLTGWGALVKRGTDIAMSALGLAVLSPVLIIVAALVKLTSKGPVLYPQERMGLDGRSFRMYKFRSMRTDAEAESGAVWCNERDPRRTAFGSFLRKTSLDELPQLWNVLQGDMSLVGPRPERPVFVHKFRREIPNYMLRHKVKTGITGWAQVNGWRGNTSLTRRVECDIFYIRNWSYFLDLKILLMTVWKGFIHKNAY